MKLFLNNLNAQGGSVIFDKIPGGTVWAYFDSQDPMEFDLKDGDPGF